MTKLDNIYALTNLGCRIFPIVTGQAKPKSDHIKTATTDRDKINRYFSTHPDSGFAIACGGDIAVLVVQGLESLSALLDQAKAHVTSNGEAFTAVRTVTAVDTKTKEFHFYFRATGCAVPPGATTIMNGVKLLGHGAWVFGPDSNTANARVRFMPNRGPNEVDIVDLPEWLLSKAFDNPQAVDAEIKRLAGLDELAYEREREESAKRLRLRMAVLDDQVEKARAKAKTSAVPDPEPWPEPVDGAELLNGLTEAIQRHVVLKKGEAQAIALWVVHTHALDAFDISPRLAVKSPVKQCGKSTLLDVLSCVARDPITAANITAAALFRVIDQDTPTVLIDEADTFLIKDDALRGILNSGHRRNTAFVMRADGENLQPRRFSTWAPVAIACIGVLPETLEDRSIQVTLRRRLLSENIEPFRSDRTNSYLDLSRMTARWSADHMQQLKAADPKVPAGIANREADNWRPLWAIADAAGGDWPKRSRQIAEAMVKSDRKSDQSINASLLRDISTIFAALGIERMSSAQLVSELVKFEGHLWSEWRGNQPITQNAVARILAAFGIAPTEMRIYGKVLRGYNRVQFADAFARYLQDASIHPVVTSQLMV
jgi:putative DNA primase/helicase